MNLSRLFLLLLPLITQNANGQSQTISFKTLLKQTLKYNIEILESKKDRISSKISVDNLARLNDVNLELSFKSETSDADQNLAPTYSISQDITEANLSLNGALPKLGLSYDASYNNFSQDQGSFLAQSGLSREGSFFDLEVKFALLENAGFLVGNIPFEFEKKRFNVAQNSLSLTLQQRVLTLLENYLELLALQEKREVTKVFIKQAKVLNKIYLDLYKEGKVSKVDLLSSEFQINTQINTIKAFNLRIVEIWRAVNEIVGKPSQINNFNDLNFTYFETGLFNTVSEKKHKALNPEIELITSRIDLTNNELEGLKNKLLPTVNLFARMSSSTPEFTPGIIGTEEFDQSSVSFGIELSAPIGNWDARSNFKTKKIEKLYLERQRQSLISSIRARLTSLKNEINVSNDLLKSLKKIESISVDRYNAALPLVQRSVSARIDIFSFQNESVELKYQLADLKNTIIQKEAQKSFLIGSFEDKIRSFLNKK